MKRSSGHCVISPPPFQTPQWWLTRCSNNCLSLSPFWPGRTTQRFATFHFVKTFTDVFCNMPQDLEALQEVREGLLRKGGLLVSINGDAPQFSLRLGGDGKNEWLVWKEEFVQKLKDSSHIDQSVLLLVLSQWHLLTKPPTQVACSQGLSFLEGHQAL